MVRGTQSYIFLGMEQDDTPVRHSGKVLRDALNIRMYRAEGLDLVAIVNERSSEHVINIPGYYLGHAIIGKYLVLFTTCPSYEVIVNEHEVTIEKKDYIIRVDMTNPLDSNSIVYLYDSTDGDDQSPRFIGDLNFSLEYPIETIIDVENENIQKVYWVDGLNVPRYINIIEDTSDDPLVSFPVKDPTRFDFYQHLELQEEIEVKRIEDSSSMFPSGTILYAITYSYLYGPETNIADITPVLPIKFIDRGGKPDEVVSCGFKVTIKHIDSKFDRIHIYSIVRTTKDTMPAVKRVASLTLKGMSVLNENKRNISYYDNNTTGEVVDPNYLQNLGEEKIIPSTLESKDGTMFLGNFKKEDISTEKITADLNIIDDYENRPYREVELIQSYIKEVYPKIVPKNLENISTFKYKEYYKLGVLLLDKCGRWSFPITLYSINHLGVTRLDSIFKANCRSHLESVTVDDGTDIILKLPIIKGNIRLTNIDLNNYKRIRPLIVVPSNSTRDILYLGVLCPTVYNLFSASNHSPDIQSSWFFRPDVHYNTVVNQLYNKLDKNYTTRIVTLLCYEDEWPIPFFNYSCEISGIPEIMHLHSNCWDPPDAPEFPGTGDYMPIMDKIGGYSYNRLIIDPIDHNTIRYKPLVWSMKKLTDLIATSIFKVNRKFVTFHSPDIEFKKFFHLFGNDIELQRYDKSVNLNHLISEISIDSGPAHSTNGNVVSLHKTDTSADNGIQCAGLYFKDDVLDDFEGNGVLKIKTQTVAKDFVPYYVGYPWQCSGSFTYDFDRPADAGSMTAELLHKITCNYRILSNQLAYNTWASSSLITVKNIQSFDSDTFLILRIGDKTYYGNVDTSLSQVVPYSKVIVSNVNRNLNGGADTDLDPHGIVSLDIIVLSKDGNDLYRWYGYLLYSKSPLPQTTVIPGRDIQKTSDHSPVFGDKISNIGIGGPIRMRYKSTPHLVLELNEALAGSNQSSDTGLRFVDIKRKPGVFSESPYENIHNEDLVWIPAGPALILVEDQLNNLIATTNSPLEWLYGDTWYSRYDCMKTYPYASDDVNSILEIASFECESRTNLEGRYDRNAGLLNKGTLSPVTFNLMNYVYSLLDTFFSYQIPRKDYEKNSSFSSSFTWTERKYAGAEIDAWTNLTLTSTEDLDGSKGNLNKLITWLDKLLGFQDNGIAEIAFNDRVLIPTGDDNPIEITNSYKVSGYRYLEGNYGTTNKYSICKSVSTLYFRNSKTLLLYGLSDNKFIDVSSNGKMMSYFNNIGNNAGLSDTYDIGEGSLTKDYMRTCYDFVHKDLYINTDKESLYYSEGGGAFISRLQYTKMAGLFNIDNSTYAIRVRDESMLKGDVDYATTSIYKLNSDNQTTKYNKLFDIQRESMISFIINEEGGLSKLFTDINTRLSVFSINSTTGNKEYVHNDFGFNVIDVKTEYQYLTQPLVLEDVKYKGLYKSYLKKKFNVWYLTLPTVTDSTLTSPFILKKNIRPNGTWCLVTLSTKQYNQSGTFFENKFDKKLVINDLAATFYKNYI